MKHIVRQDQPILDALQETSTGSSKTTLRSWIKEGRVFVDGEVVRQSNIFLTKGQKITIGAKKRFIGGDIQIYYEDKDLIVIEKPSGLLSVASNFQNEKTAHAYLKEYFYPKPVYVVHRIDQDTSGVMCFALSEKAYEALKVIFEKHEIERRYTAIVEGFFTAQNGKWQSYVYEDANYVVHTTLDKTKGKIAITHFEVISTSKKYSLLELTLETGRKNQIRVHCRDAEHPIVGDKKYGSTKNPTKRLMLHAHWLSFMHPITLKKMKFSSPPPPCFDTLIHR